MQKEFHGELTKAAPQVMAFIAKMYGYYLHNGEYYSTYLLDATVTERGYMHPSSIIEYLHEKYDVNLEPFKMSTGILLGHLNANRYIFHFSSLLEVEFNDGTTVRPARRIYFAKVYRLEPDFANMTPVTDNLIMSDDGTGHMQESCLEAAILVAIKHLEECYVEELKLKQTA